MLPCDALSKKDTTSSLIKLEQKYIDRYTNKYNINPIAGPTRLGSKHTEECKTLMSEVRKANPHFLNKTHSES